MSAPSIWVLADPRAGTAAQALGIAERLRLPFAVRQLAFSPLAALPNALLGASRLGLREAGWQPPWPSLVIAAGRRSAPPALWLARRGARLVHAMRPGMAQARFDLLVLPRHDTPASAPNVLEILGAPHRVTPAKLAAAAGRFANLPRPRVALLLGGPVRTVGLAADAAGALAAQVAAEAGSVLATTSRRTGHTATEAVAAALAPVPHALHRFGQAGENPYLAILADADAIVATGDSISMISEALTTPARIHIAGLPGTSGPRHRAFHASLFAAGQALPWAGRLDTTPRAPLDETARVAAEIRARGLVPEA
jgi:mitochondrial fission protein ELM1